MGALETTIFVLLRLITICLIGKKGNKSSFKEQRGGGGGENV